MSDLGLEFINPYAPGSQEDKEFRDASIRPLVLGLNAAPAHSLAQFVPLKQNEQGETSFAVPGLVTGTYGFAGETMPDLINLGLAATGIKTRLPHAPGAEWSNRSFDDSKRFMTNLMDQVIPGSKPRDESEQLIADMLGAAGGVVSPISGARAVAALPTKLLRGAAHMTLPIRENAAVVAPVAAGLAGGLEAALGPEQAAHDPADLYKNTLGDMTPSQTGGGGTTPPPFVLTPQGSILQTTQTQTGISSDLAAAPTYGKTGETEWTWKDYGKLGLGILGVGWLGLKSGKVLNPLILNKIVDNAQDAATIAAKNATIRATEAGVQNVEGAKIGEVYRGEMSLPGEGGTLGTRFSQQHFDSSAVVRETLKGSVGQVDPALSKQLAATYGNTLHSAAESGKLTRQLETGVNGTNGDIGPKVLGTLQKIAQTSAEQRQTLFSGMWAASEKNERDAFRAARPNRTLTDEETRFNLYRDDTTTLDQRIAKMQADPVLAEVQRDFRAINAFKYDQLEKMGRISSSEATRLRTYHLDRLPDIDQHGVAENMLDPRYTSRRMGVESPTTTPWEAMVQDYYHSFHEMNSNAVLRDIVNNLHSWQLADPNRPLMVTPKQFTTEQGVKDVQGPRERAITIYENGQAKTFYVNNTALYHGLIDNPVKASVTAAAANSMRQILQHGTTGVSGSLLGLRPFSIINMNRGIMRMGTERRPGRAGGLIDKGLQKLGLPGYRGFDPTTVPMVYGEAAINAAAVTAKNFGDMLMMQSHPFAQALRGIAGDQWINSASKWLSARYEATLAAQRHAGGASGGGSFGSVEPLNFQIGRSQRKIVDPLRSQTDLNMTGTLPGTQVKIPGGKALTSTYVNMRSMLRDIHREVSDSPNAYYFRLNRNNPKISRAELIQETNSLFGDPSVSGISKSAQWLGRNVPYYNPTLQDALRVARNFRDNPVSYSVGMMSTLAMAALAETFSAMISGPGHVDHLENRVSTQQREQNVIFYHGPGSEPTDHTEISLAQHYRPFYPLMLELVSTLTGAFQARNDEPLNERLVNTLSDFFQQHVRTSTHTSMLHGVSDFLDMSPPTWVEAGIAAFGGTFRSPVSQMIMNADTGKPYTEGIFGGSSDAQSRVPGRMASSSIVAQDDGTWMQQVLSAVIGGAAAAYHWAYQDTKARMDDGESFWGAMGGLGSSAGQTFKDRSPFGNIIWGNNTALSNYNPLEENVSSALYALRKIGGSGDITSYGFASGGSVKPLPITGRGGDKVPQDPQMQELYVMAFNYKTGMEPIEKRISDLRKGISAVNALGYSQDDKRKMLNNLSTQLNAAYEEADERIQMLHEQLSQMTGGRHVDIRTIKWDKGIEQFH